MTDVPQLYRMHQYRERDLHQATERRGLVKRLLRKRKRLPPPEKKR